MDQIPMDFWMVVYMAFAAVFSMWHWNALIDAVDDWNDGFIPPTLRKKRARTVLRLLVFSTLGAALWPLVLTYLLALAFWYFLHFGARLLKDAFVQEEETSNED